ncbi:hypothetical protein [Xenorhabdus bovienii]|uniref:hypothetical protein n=1 Tax=Xenorhabdus bovienii TaxID=40576 RepID=UPI0023B26AC2|nr:hypothetical protein [Xenorhabdus bovienii]MDE9536183.1 hypothetical protein [Xenorhabdus bovienii]MDE9589121.1 hypothetical protein [Xenorhabdus bovienii]
MLVEKNNLSNLKLTQKISVPNGADVFIGQWFILDVEILASLPLPSDFEIKLDNLFGLEIDNSYSGSSVFNKDRTVFKDSFLLTVGNSDSIKSGDKLSYDIIVNDVPINVIYHARDMDSSQMMLTADKKFIAAQDIENIIGVDNNHYIIFSEELKDKSGRSMKNTPIKIGTSMEDEIEVLTFSTNSVLPEIIKPTTVGSMKFITVHSDSSGNIKFRFYPTGNRAMLLKLISMVDSVAVEGETVYVISPRPTQSNKWLPKAIIPALINGILRKDGEEFKVKVPAFHYASPEDRIFFLTNLKDGIPDSNALISSYFLGSSSGGHYSYCLNYDKLPANKFLKIYYVIISEFANIAYSAALDVEYLES